MRAAKMLVWGIGMLCLSGRAAIAQAPVTLTGNPLQGAIDFHVHSGPDSFTRSVTDLEIAKIAKANGMQAIVLKNHFTMTADRAWLAERATGMRCYGGIVLNRAVGGLNAAAVEQMVAFTGGRGKVVWLPTFDAENHVARFQEKRPFVSVVRDGKPVPELKPIFDLAAKHDLVLETGHSSAEECLILIRAAKKAGVKRLLVTHAMADPVRMSIDQMKEAARLGAKLECVWLSNLQGPQSHLPSQRQWKHVSTKEYAKAIRGGGGSFRAVVRSGAISESHPHRRHESLPPGTARREFYGARNRQTQPQKRRQTAGPAGVMPF